ncbi:hypothetical protein GCM10010206_60020 [Streptomyces cinerochromogenes]|nr:hypothetical protein GCM10010206_60020 [Streptomyces cinerochromogenes]
MGAQRRTVGGQQPCGICQYPVKIISHTVMLPAGTDSRARTPGPRTPPARFWRSSKTARRQARGWVWRIRASDQTAGEWDIPRLPLS